ncbi:cytochrome P450 [Tanacetum coccineum]
MELSPMSPELPWTKVQNRKHRQNISKPTTSHQSPLDPNLTTFYFTNFPTNWNHATMLDVFKKYGDATDVYIVQKRNKMGKRFGFCRFARIKDNQEFERILNTICFSNQKILCNIAIHQRKPPPKSYFNPNANTTRYHALFSSNSKHNGSSYAAIATRNTNHSRESPKHIINLQSPPVPSTSPSQHLKNSIIAELKTTIGATNTYNIIRDEGFDDFSIKYLGGLHLLLNFPDETSASKAPTNITLRTHFSSIDTWSNNFRITKRVIWPAISGIPIQLWSPESFSTIAKHWGEIIIPKECNPRQFNRTTGKVCILSKHLELIHTTCHVPYGKDIIPIRIFETEGEIDLLFNGYVLDSSSDEDDNPKGETEGVNLRGGGEDWTDDDDEDADNSEQDGESAAGNNKESNSGDYSKREMVWKYKRDNF